MLEVRTAHAPKPLGLEWNLDGLLEAVGIVASQAVLALMWILTVYEFSMILAVPLLFPGIKAGMYPHDVVWGLYMFAYHSHAIILPPVLLFLAYDGFDMLTGRESEL